MQQGSGLDSRPWAAALLLVQNTAIAGDRHLNSSGVIRTTATVTTLIQCTYNLPCRLERTSTFNIDRLQVWLYVKSNKILKLPVSISIHKE